MYLSQRTLFQIVFIFPKGILALCAKKTAYACADSFMLEHTQHHCCIKTSQHKVDFLLVLFVRCPTIVWQNAFEYDTLFTIHSAQYKRLFLFSCLVLFLSSSALIFLSCMNATNCKTNVLCLFEVLFTKFFECCYAAFLLFRFNSNW